MKSVVQATMIAQVGAAHLRGGKENRGALSPDAAVLDPAADAAPPVLPTDPTSAMENIQATKAKKIIDEWYDLPAKELTDLVANGAAEARLQELFDKELQEYVKDSYSWTQLCQMIKTSNPDAKDKPLFCRFAESAIKHARTAQEKEKKDNELLQQEREKAEMERKQKEKEAHREEMKRSEDARIAEKAEKERLDMERRQKIENDAEAREREKKEIKARQAEEKKKSENKNLADSLSKLLEADVAGGKNHNLDAWKKLFQNHTSYELREPTDGEKKKSYDSLTNLLQTASGIQLSDRICALLDAAFLVKKRIKSAGDVKGGNKKNKLEVNVPEKRTKSADDEKEGRK